MTTSEIISAAHLHLHRARGGNWLAAKSALGSAIRCYAQNRDGSARGEAIVSLAYSLGTDSALYKLASRSDLARVESLSESARIAESQAHSCFFGI